MHIELVNGVPMLCVNPDIHITFQVFWIENLSKLRYEMYGEYIKSKIYPFLSNSDQKLWNKSTISNKGLQEAVVEFMRG